MNQTRSQNSPRHVRDFNFNFNVLVPYVIAHNDREFVASVRTSHTASAYTISFKAYIKYTEARLGRIIQQNTNINSSFKDLNIIHSLVYSWYIYKASPIAALPIFYQVSQLSVFTISEMFGWRPCGNINRCQKFFLRILEGQALVLTVVKIVCRINVSESFQTFFCSNMRCFVSSWRITWHG